MKKPNAELVATIKTNLESNPRWIERAIVVLYERQTADEKMVQETGHNNGVGFNKPDARRMSFIAEFLKKGGHLTTEKALKYGLRLQKYAGQLARIAEEKAAAQAVQNTAKAA